MAQEDQNQRPQNSVGGGSGCRTKSPPAKRLKQKKIPQRGLGVAQLEKIRLEEQRNKAAASFSPSLAGAPPPSSPIPPSSAVAPSSHSYPPLPISGYAQAKAHIPFPPPSPAAVSSPGSSGLHPSADINSGYDLGSVQLPCRAHRGVTAGGHGSNVPRFLNAEFMGALDGEESTSLKADHRLALGLPSEWSSPLVLQRTQQLPTPPPMVTASAMASTSTPLAFQTEPPSNQSYCFNKPAMPMWPDEDKVPGVKRAYPFSLENQAGLSFQTELSAFNHSFSSWSDDSAPGRNYGGGSLVFEPIDPTREAPPSSASPAEMTDNEDGGLRGDLLTLAPPVFTAPNPLPAHLLPPGNDFESSVFEPPPENEPGATHDKGPTRRSIHPSPFYSFLPPPAELQIGEAAGGEIQSSSSVEGYDVDVDLSLKL